MPDTPHGQTQIFSRSDLEVPELKAFAHGELVVYSRRCPGSDVVSEDSAAVIPLSETAGVLVVADGAGGMPCGEEASRIVVETLTDAVQKAWGGGESLRSAVLDGIERANDAVKATGTGAGTTVAVAIFEDNTVRTVHVGDSMVLLSGQKGKVKFQTTAHSPVGYGVEAGLLNDEEALTHDERHMVSNLLGTQMSIEVGPQLDLARRDTLLIASDGLADNLRIEEIVEFVRAGPLLESCTAMIEACRLRMMEPADGQPSHADDLTVLVFRPSP